MGKKNRAKQIGKFQDKSNRHKKELMALAADLVRMCVDTYSRQEEWNYFIKLYSAVENFRKHQSVNDGIVDDKQREESMPAFETWLAENDVTYQNCQLQDVGDEGFGVVASADITAKDVLVSVPRSIMMKCEDAINSYLGPLIRSHEMLSLMPNICLALYLHCEKYNSKSSFKPYIDILPKTFTTTLYFSPDELKLLKGSATLNAAIQQYRSIVRQFAYLYQMLHGSQLKQHVEKLPPAAVDAFTFDAYRWCVSAVTTRQNKIPSVGDTRDLGCCDQGHECGENHSTLALIPLWDMLNHSVGVLSTSYNPETEHIECLAMRDFAQGEQVTICYGGRPNHDLLVHNGFVMHDNPFDKVKIALGISDKDVLYKKRVSLLEQLGLEPSGYFNVCAMDGHLPVTPSLLAFLRIFHMKEDELDSWLCSKEQHELVHLQEIYMPGTHSDRKDEVPMWSYLENRILLLLRTYETLLNESKSDLVADRLSSRAKLAISLRMEEHKVLSTCFVFCQQFRKALTSDVLQDLDSLDNGDAVKLSDREQTLVRQRVGCAKFLQGVLSGHTLAQQQQADVSSLSLTDKGAKEVNNENEVDEVVV